MFLRLVAGHSPTRWDMEITEQLHCLLIYAVHTSVGKNMDTVMLGVWRVPALHVEMDPKLFGGCDLAQEFPKVMREGEHDKLLNSWLFLS